MKLTEPEFRCPTRAAIDKLAETFSLPNTPEMQDWEWEVADSSRIEEFLNEYKKESISEDERFTLLEILLQSFEESETVLNKNDLWQEMLSLAQQNYKLHAHTVWYWSDFENENEDDQWKVTPFMRKLYANNV